MNGTGLSVNKGVIRPADVLPDSAVSPLLITQFTEARAKGAFYFSIGMFFVKPGFDMG